MFVLYHMLSRSIWNQSYEAEIDWWSVDIIFYEMLIGFPPFLRENYTTKDISLKLKNFKRYLKKKLNIPNGVEIS